MIAIVEQRDARVIPLDAACVALGVSRASLYRERQPVYDTCKPAPNRGPNPRRLADAERREILDVLHLPEFADQPPAEVYAALLGRGQYLGSIRTLYRVLAESGETRERRNQRPPHAYAKPSLTATGPNQVWTWDITKLATKEKGVFLMAYVIIDLFSRYVVGWMVAKRECKHLAALLFAETIARHGIEPGQLVSHSDRGSSMKSETLAQLLVSLGVSRSFNRPHVSNDNPFSEAQFRTLKYQPDYPGRFEGTASAEDYLSAFFGWYNDDHHHSGLALYTPAEVFFGRVEEVALVRQAALDGAYEKHPERFPNGAPITGRPPAEVRINPLTNDTVAVKDPKLADEASVGPSLADQIRPDDNLPDDHARLGSEPTRRHERAATEGSLRRVSGQGESANAP